MLMVAPREGHEKSVMVNITTRRADAANRIPGETLGTMFEMTAAPAHQQWRDDYLMVGNDTMKKVARHWESSAGKLDRPQVLQEVGAEDRPPTSTSPGRNALQSGANGQGREGDPYIDKRNDDGSAAVEEATYGLAQ